MYVMLHLIYFIAITWMSAQKKSSDPFIQNLGSKLSHCVIGGIQKIGSANTLLEGRWIAGHLIQMKFGVFVCSIC